MGEAGLVLFSVLLQAAIGFSGALFIFRHRILTHVNGNALTWTMFGIACTAGIGLMLAMTHMKYPLNAPYAMTNLTTSWLSREVILAPIFIGIIGYLFLIGITKKSFNTNLLLVAVIIGVLDVISLANIYMASYVATWNSMHSIATHVGGMFLLGASLMTVYLSRIPGCHETIIRRLLGFIMLSLAVRAYTQLTLLVALEANSGSQGIMFPWNSVDAFYNSIPILFLAWVFACIGVVLSCVRLVRKKQQHIESGWFTTLIIGSFLLFELLARTQFYMIHT
ncbi:dimethyl sulfoxide reductase anchor subunit [Vibrio parahaemolyticus]|nr:dimethyl sulfoxide reductase anchor subunit [Vibrio parahaemolyticus]EIZ4252156.1 dimethyl sulfoxide reductase anchor subunit [Vibrio parahaemolyticus]